MGSDSSRRGDEVSPVQNALGLVRRASDKNRDPNRGFWSLVGSFYKDNDIYQEAWLRYPWGWRVGS